MSSSDKGKPLLYVDLFKPRKTTASIEEDSLKAHDGFQGPSSSSSVDSYCSGFSTPFDSELSSSGAGSEEGEGDEAFMAELSRQMAECMLDEDESIQSCEDFEMYEPRNEPAPVLPTKKNQGGRYYRSGKRNNVGSGMKAVFLGQYGPPGYHHSSGTGVFLPRLPGDPAQKKKPGCSTVLIPTRLLHALELHFNTFSHSTSPQTIARAGDQDSRNGALHHQSGASDREKCPESMVEEMHLPQEWTY